MRKIKTLVILALLCCSNVLLAQTVVTGKVTDSKTGDALQNASILIKGSSIGTSTDNSGTYRLSVSQENAVLVFSSLGYTVQEIKVTGNLLNVALVSSGTKNLDEIVVVGYGTKIKKDLTGNIAKVKGSDVQNMPVPNLNQALQGRAAGVFVEANNGKVGEGVKILIRGSGSISASNSPLYVIDGVPISTNTGSGNALADINFNDIESFDILKDASAAAIYGSRAANGVVLISTKKGRAGKTSFQVNTQYGRNKPTHLRGFLNAKEYVDLLREAAINSDNIDGIDPTDPAQYSGSWLEFAERRLTRYSG